MITFEIDTLNECRSSVASGEICSYALGLSDRLVARHLTLVKMDSIVTGGRIRSATLRAQPVATFSSATYLYTSTSIRNMRNQLLRASYVVFSPERYPSSKGILTDIFLSYAGSIAYPYLFSSNSLANFWVGHNPVAYVL